MPDADIVMQGLHKRELSMEINWLYDFIAVATARSFSRAAEERNCSQPALSRRIQALEVWAGASLLDRTTHSVNLTPAGEAFRHTADDIVRRLSAGRLEAQERARGASDVLKFASTNALSLTFFPDWLRRIETELPFVPNVQLVANHMEGCERILLASDAHFLLCHYHPAATTALTPSHFRSLHVGDDRLIPASVPVSRRNRKPRFKLPGTEGAPVQFLSFRSESGMGRILEAVRATSPLQAHLHTTFTSHLAKLLVTMVQAGRGMAWLPESLISDQLASGEIVAAGGQQWYVPIEIHVFRPKLRLAQAAEAFWQHIEKAATHSR
ncbi:MULTISPECIES: LysR family transcriptional regulator [Bradyrhizobium]|uniref:LysR substrate-binding domain-containing protein n=3 Tax=Bradyrhizobium TaxID=374 RepID=A0A9X1R8I6_9BRAD|nr:MULTISPECIES: LysR family transcriptional regulator [Bradyrhizobium]MCG2628204.1 LysR substrate-binding domain-containing protein [Bradyrhizobium zhengyangense]MCG2643323.1 LysR substrate-binding domain-containing protein [Bradyrhizobium zhengyangense]MCG2670363.1 LysR substrate-binding domain-containing protein [Bradyrhizobium zhengyangense]MDN4985902.1 LysR substrate-binding domain-containing protein [Bradyrhizobium sp. WYCCWR 13022]MDT4736744.1 LysR substrate-binding domain-containing pr